MDFEYEQAHQRVYDIVGELGRSRFAPRAQGYDERAELPRENLRDLFDAGLLGLSISKSLGGGGGGALGEDPLISLLVVEQAARYCLSTAQSVHIHYNAAHMVDQIGTDEQRERILRPVLEQGELLNATGSEPGRTARGLYGLQTVATPVPGGYRVSGLKNYATLADDVSYNILYAVIKDVPQPEGHIGLMVPRGAPGLVVRPHSWNPMGMRAAHSPEVELHDVFVAADNVLGAPGIFPRDHWQTKSHLSFAIQYVGASEGIFDILVDYLPKRGTAADGYAQLRLGEIRIAIDSARWLVYRAVALWRRKAFERAELFSMNAKYQAMSIAVSVMDKAAQIAGSSAFAAGSPLSRAIRDLRVQTLHENLDKTAATVGKFHLGQAYDTSARL
ncbi:acyl-CoA dehydrogenase family protein [Pseudomonas typographi]|uniref:acyl-CoA dehydrogenase family protein n=1 Tax=Pseudomonas typographi TaxID=2715964 RepID=UPI00168343D1|nr:acyl-CoA dehydrogenase family protein [Pseudomonas typographi]MBD1586612.1 acyl-CoA/acyl-ACP dehydrogenase [Pseudomonas typographi]